MKKTLVCAFITIICANAHAQVYSCGPGCYTSNAKNSVGRANLGNKIGSYTSTPVKQETQHTKTVSAPPRPSATHTRHSAPSRPAPVANAAPAPVSAPPLSPARTSSRRTILEQELNNERNALSMAQKALAEGRAVSGQSDANHQNRIRGLESAVLDRQQNIQALQRELSRM